MVGVVRFEDTWKERTMERQDVEFTVEDNVALRGWLLVPDGPGPHPEPHITPEPEWVDKPA